MSALPVIDLSPLAEGEAGLRRVAAEIGLACRDVGFFYVKNHGVDAALIDAAFAQSEQLFALPLEVKQSLAIQKIGGNRGYAALLHEALDPAQGPDLKEAFNIGLDLAPDDPELLAGVPFRALNAWPPLPDYKPTALAYFEACTKLALQLHSCFAADLGLPLDFFADKFSKPMTTLRMLHYPPAQSRIGAGTHTDYGNITLLATDEVGGLQVRKRGGEWIDAPVVPGAYVVNIGDCLMRWTNHIYVSTPHRVINESGRERYSIAFFFDPNPEAEVAAIPSCVAPGEPPRHPPIAAADYLKSRLYATMPAGF